MSESKGLTDEDRAFLKEEMSPEGKARFHAEFMAAHEVVDDSGPFADELRAAYAEKAATRARRERIVESARRMFEACRGGIALECLRAARGFENAVDAFDFEEGAK